MNRLRSPIVVTPPPPSVPRWMVTNSRKMLPVADLEPGRLALVFQVLRRQPDRRDTGRFRCRRRSSCALRSPPTRRSCSCGRCVTCGPITANGADHRARADHRGRRHARQRIDVRRSACTASSSSASTTVWPSTSATAVAFTSGPRVAPSVTIELQLIAGNDVLAELGVVDAAQLHAAAAGAPGVIEQQQRRRLRQRLDHEDRRHQRLAAEMSLEKIFVDGDVLERDQPLPRLVLGDGVDEQRGKAVGEAFENVHLAPDALRRTGRSPAFTDPGASSVLAGLAAGGLAESSFLMTSAEMSSAASAHTRPASGPLNTNCRPISVATCCSTGSRRCWNSCCSACCSSCTSACASCVKRCTSSGQPSRSASAVAGDARRSSPSLPSRASAAWP